jgi:hypothetical protein
MRVTLPKPQVMLHPGVPLLAALASLGCGKEDPKFIFEKKPIPVLPYQGFRRDIPDEQRGNAVFVKAVFTNDDRYLVTLSDGIQVFDAKTGALLRVLPAGLSGSEPLVADGPSHTVLARRLDYNNAEEAYGLWIWDLRDGSRVGPIPGKSEDSHPVPIGITPRGEAVILREGRIETWGLDGTGPRISLEAPPGRPFCTPSSGIDRDKRCTELSRSGRWLVTTARDSASPTTPDWTFLIDLETGAQRRIVVPNGRDARSQHFFAFSRDEHTLAMQVADGMWIGYPVDSAMTDTLAVGQLVRGEHSRGNFLTPMTYTADGAGIVALGDQYTVATYGAASGELRGRVTPPFEDREGALRVSDDGSRAIAYRYVADILVVIDGTTGQQRGYICPYCCNRAHNPIEVPYAVSPDGRRVATGGRLGAGLWDTDADTLIAPLRNPAMKPLKPR